MWSDVTMPVLNILHYKSRFHKFSVQNLIFTLLILPSMQNSLPEQIPHQQGSKMVEKTKKKKKKKNRKKKSPKKKTFLILYIECIDKPKTIREKEPNDTNRKKPDRWVSISSKLKGIWEKKTLRTRCKEKKNVTEHQRPTSTRLDGGTRAARSPWFRFQTGTEGSGAQISAVLDWEGEPIPAKGRCDERLDILRTAPCRRHKDIYLCARVGTWEGMIKPRPAPGLGPGLGPKRSTVVPGKWGRMGTILAVWLTGSAMIFLFRYLSELLTQ